MSKKSSACSNFAHRLTRGIGSWHCQRSTWLSAMRELPHPISPTFCQGQCYSMDALFFKCSFGIRIWLELELMVFALEPSSLVSGYYVSLRLTEWHASCHSCSNGKLWNTPLYPRWIRWNCHVGYVTSIFLSPQGRLQGVKGYCHHLRDILATYCWSEYFHHNKCNG